MAVRKTIAVTLASLLSLQPGTLAAQTQCITEDEVSAMAIYSVPTLVQAVRNRCSAQLAPAGFLAQRGDSFSGRYTGLQRAVWPRAKSGLLKYAAGKAWGTPQNMDMLTNLPDNAVRPLIDALVLQEATARILPRHCVSIERAMAALAPIDPEVAGTLLGVAVGIAAPKDAPICPARRT